MLRKFPATGFYTFSDAKFIVSEKLNATQIANLKNTSNYKHVVFCSGTTKGNYYIDPNFHGNTWNFLTWTCVPSIKSAAECYDFSLTNPTNIPLP